LIPNLIFQVYLLRETTDTSLPYVVFIGYVIWDALMLFIPFSMTGVLRDRFTKCLTVGSDERLINNSSLFVVRYAYFIKPNHVPSYPSIQYSIFLLFKTLLLF